MAILVLSQVESSTDSTKTPTEAAQAVSSEAPQDGPKPKTASTKVAKTDPEVSYSLNILWQEQFCAVSVDQIVQKVGCATWRLPASLSSVRTHCLWCHTALTPSTPRAVMRRAGNEGAAHASDGVLLLA